MKAKVVRIVKKNIINTYAVSNYLEFNFTDKDQKHMIYKQFVELNCDSCLVASLTGHDTTYSKNFHPNLIILTYLAEDFTLK